MPPEPPAQIGPYRVAGVLGETAAATLYRGVDPATGAAVTLKVAAPSLAADAEAAERFLAHGERMAALDHPNLVRVLAARREGDDLYLVMDYVEGTSLESLLKERRLSLKEAVGVAREVGRALEFAHRQGVVHRNLTPSNVLVTGDLSRIKVTDFGITRMDAVRPDGGTLATGHLSVARMTYLAPEEAAAPGRGDARCDVYSLGVIFYEMLTGRPPSGKVSLPSHAAPDVPSAVDPVVLRCLAMEPARRYPAVAPLLADLRRLEESLHLRLVDELKGFSRTGQRIIDASPAPQGRRTRLLLLGVLLAVLALAAAGWVLLGGG